MTCSIVATTIFLTAKPPDTKGAPCNMCNSIAVPLKIAFWDLSEIEIFYPYTYMLNTLVVYLLFFSFLHLKFFQAITYSREVL